MFCNQLNSTQRIAKTANSLRFLLRYVPSAIIIALHSYVCNTFCSFYITFVIYDIIEGLIVLFYEQFNKLCLAHNIKETSLARELGMGASAPGRWKNGSTPDLVNAKKIADYFGVTVDSLIAENETKASNLVTNITGSAVLQGNSGSNVNLSVGGQAGAELTDQEQEILRIFRGLTPRGQNEMMTLIFQVEDKYKAD